MTEKSETLTFRADPATARRVEELARRRLEKKSDILRKAVLEYLKKELGLKEIRRLAAKKYAEGEIVFEDLVKLLGYEQAKKVAFYVEVAEKSFQEGLK